MKKFPNPWGIVMMVLMAGIVAATIIIITITVKSVEAGTPPQPPSKGLPKPTTYQILNYPVRVLDSHFPLLSVYQETEFMTGIDYHINLVNISNNGSIIPATAMKVQVQFDLYEPAAGQTNCVFSYDYPFVYSNGVKKNFGQVNTPYKTDRSIGVEVQFFPSFPTETERGVWFKSTCDLHLRLQILGWSN